MKFKVLILMLVFFLTPSVFAQKRKPVRKSGAAIARVSRPALAPVMTICVNDTLPKGYWIVRETFDYKCPIVNNFPRALVISVDGKEPGHTPAVASKPSVDSKSDDGDDVIIRVGRGRSKSDEEKEKTANEKRAEESVTQAKFENAVRENTIQVGMNMDQVVRAWGGAYSVDKGEVTSDNPVISEMWTYYRGGQKAYVYFKDGIVSRWEFTRK
jgi:hypothetical protein